jgi:hypothetical protein
MFKKRGEHENDAADVIDTHKEHSSDVTGKPHTFKTKNTILKGNREHHIRAELQHCD